MIIREATVNDAGALSAIYKYYVDNYSYSFEYTAPPEAVFSKRIADISEKFPYYVCEHEGEILGFAYAHQFHERKAFQWICETSIYTKSDHAQKGVGAMLYHKLILALKKQGFTKAYAVIGCPNEASERFHQKMGFSFVAVLPDIGYKLGAWHDIKYYVLTLNAASGDMPEPLAYKQIPRDAL